MPRRKSTRRLKKLVQTIVSKNVETSSSNHSFSSLGIVDAGRASSATDIHVTNISQGTGEGQRIKNEVRVTGIHSDFFITGADSTNSIRLILYTPKDLSVSLSNSPALAFNQTPDLDKFTVLLDKFVCTSSNGTNCKRVKFNFKFKGRGLRVGYSGSAGSTVQTHPLYFYLVSDSLAVTDPTINGYMRVYYKDA